MAALRYNLTGTQGMDFSRRLTVNLASGTVEGATFPVRVFNRHDHTGTPVCEAAAVVVDAPSSLIEITISRAEMGTLDPSLVYAWQIDGEAEDLYIEPLAQGRFYVEPRYNEGGGTP